EEYHFGCALRARDPRINAGPAGLSLDPLDLGDLSQQVADFIAVQAGDLGNPVDVADEVGLGAEERLEAGLTFDARQQAPVGRDTKLLDSWRAPVLAEQAPQDGREHAARLDRAHLAGAIFPDLLRLWKRLVAHG